MTHLEVVQAYMAGWDARDADAVLATLNPDGTYEDPSCGRPVSGASFKAYMRGLWLNFPDLSFETRSIGALGPDLLAAQWVMRGTHQGSAMGFPPTGKSVELEGADFFRMQDGRIQSVRGYFDTRSIPAQLGLDVITQPKQAGPFRFGTATSVQTGKTQEPGAFSITSMEAADPSVVQDIRLAARASIVDMLKIDGFIGATTATIGTRLVTITAWDSPESSRRVMKEGQHAEAQRMMFDGKITKGGYTSVWTKHHVNAPFQRCDACGKVHRGVPEDRTCSCGATLPEPMPFW